MTKFTAHALVLMVCRLTSPVKKAIAYFATQSRSGTILFFLLWKAIGYLETFANVTVIALALDKATLNQFFYQMHKSEDEETAYKPKNPFARDGERYIYFFQMPPLIEDIKNLLILHLGKELGFCGTRVMACCGRMCKIVMKRIPSVT